MMYKTEKCIIEGEACSQDYKIQALLHLNSQNIEAWKVKSLSAGRVNTVVAC